MIAASATANVAVIAQVTSTAMVAVMGNSKGHYHCNSGSDGKGGDKATASAPAKVMVEMMGDTAAICNSSSKGSGNCKSERQWQ